MGKLPIAIAKKILRLIEGEIIPSGQLKSKHIDSMIVNDILQVRLQGRSRKTIFAVKPDGLINFLNSHYGIADLNSYIHNLEHGTTRAENIISASDSKSSSRRTFRGFLVNCFSPIEGTLRGQKFMINPIEGVYSYIHDYDDFLVSYDTLIVGVENSENFRYIEKQKYLFKTTSILFVNRYPQTKDLISWIQKIPNEYLHYGDFDFEGIRIFRDEYYQYLKDRASFYIPENIESLINKYGSKDLYNRQYKSSDSTTLILNNDIEKLISLFHKYKKCLEQEVLIQMS